MHANLSLKRISLSPTTSALAIPSASLRAVSKASATLPDTPSLYHNPVHHDIYVVLLVLVEGYILGKVYDLLVYPGPQEPVLPELVKLLLILPSSCFSLPGHRGSPCSLQGVPGADPPSGRWSGMLSLSRTGSRKASLPWQREASGSRISQ